MWRRESTLDQDPFDASRFDNFDRQNGTPQSKRGQIEMLGPIGLDASDRSNRDVILTKRINIMMPVIKT